MRTTARLGIVLGLLAAGVSCRQIVGVDERQFNEGGPLVRGLPTLGATPDCAPCMMRECGADSEYCANVDGCAKLSGCVQACASGDSPCRAKCFAQPLGQTPDTAAREALELLEDCREAKCAAACTGGPWACVGRAEWTFSPFVPTQLPIRAELFDAGKRSAVEGATGRVCSLADPMCASPLATGMSNATGVVTLNVDVRLHPPPLSVFVEYRGEGLLDTLVSLNTPPVAAGTLDLGRIVMDSAATAALAATNDLHTTYDPARAIVAVFPYDCGGRPASLIAKVEFPDADAQTTTLQPYPVTGEALAMNLPVNAPALLARVVARVWGNPQIVAAAGVVVRPAAKTWVYLNPTP